jgi:hypothetical protein
MVADAIRTRGPGHRTTMSGDAEVVAASAALPYTPGLETLGNQKSLA